MSAPLIYEPAGLARSTAALVSSLGAPSLPVVLRPAHWLRDAAMSSPSFRMVSMYPGLTVFVRMP